MSLFITFEGIEGSGKTTQIKYLEAHLRKKGFRVVLTREPGGTYLGEKLRSLLLKGKVKIWPYAELFLILAQRAQHVEEVIVPSLSEGKLVLCDRFSDATLAYQGYGRGIDLNLVKNLNNIATKNVRPHLTFLIDCDVDLSLKRRGKGRDRFEREEREFHERVRNGYLSIASSEPDRIKVIDGNKKKEALKREIIATVEEIILRHGIH